MLDSRTKKERAKDSKIKSVTKTSNCLLCQFEKGHSLECPKYKPTIWKQDKDVEFQKGIMAGKRLAIQEVLKILDGIKNVEWYEDVKYVFYSDLIKAKKKIKKLC